MFNNFSPYPSFLGNSSYQQIAQSFGQQQGNMLPPSGGQMTPQFQQNTNIIFVNGMEGAKAYQLSPNSNVILMDSENSKFYVKSTDNLGVPKLTTYTFSEEENLPVSQPTSQLPSDMVAVKSEDLNVLMAKISEFDSFKQTVESKLSELL